MKLVGIIVVYNPNSYELVKNVEKLIPHLDGLIVFKNSGLSVETKLRDICGERLFIIGDGLNVGVAKALNESIVFARNNFFTHILSLDQDSYFHENHLSRFRSLVKVSFDESNVGICAPNFVNGGKQHVDGFAAVVEVQDVITSGSIYPVKIFSEVGGFDNDLFIDCIDIEFCYRIRSNYGYKILLFPTIHLIHELGYTKKSILGFHTINYSAFRSFYLVRNHIMIWRKYPNLYRSQYKVALLTEYIFYRFVKVVLAEDNKLSKIIAIIRGLWVGLSKRI
jgi:rhamnosyltransferase